MKSPCCTSLLPLALLLTGVSHAGVAQGSPRQPEPAPMGRLADHRVGPWYSTDRYVYRQRLVRTDPSGPSSAVVHPIVYVIDSTVPRRWIPWIRRGLDEWTVAFDKIGFRHAIDVREAKSGDATVTMPGCLVTWDLEPRPSAITHVEVDDTNGNVTACSITLNQGFIDMLSQQAFVSLGATHSAIHFPFPDSITGRFLARIVAHEAGHSLGFDENYPSGTFYPTDSLHRASFVHRFGFTPSVMGYTHFNFVAQRADHIDLDDLIARVGPLDVWMLGWAYRPVPEAKTPEEELPALERWRAVQDTAFGWHQTTSLTGVETADAFLLGNDLVASAEAFSRNLAVTVPQIDSQAALAEPSNPTAAAAQAEGMRSIVGSYWPHVIASPATMLGDHFPKRPSSRDDATPQMQMMDSATQVRAFHYALAHIMYGQDPLARVLFGRTSRDTSLLLFAKDVPGWSPGTWQGMQQRMVTYFNKNWRTLSQTTSPHVFPVWCQGMQGLLHDLREVSTGGTASPDEKRQADAIVNALGRIDTMCKAQ